MSNIRVIRDTFILNKNHFIEPVKLYLQPVFSINNDMCMNAIITKKMSNFYYILVGNGLIYYSFLSLLSFPFFMYHLSFSSLFFLFSCLSSSSSQHH